MANDDVKMKVTADTKEARKEIADLSNLWKAVGEAAKAAMKKAEKEAAEAAKEAKKFTNRFKRAIDDIKSKLDKFGKRFQALNDAIELGQKAWGAVMAVVNRVAEAYNRAIEASLNLRGATDNLVKEYNRLQTEILAVDAAIGTMGLAAETALNKKMAPALKESSKLLQESGGYIAEVIADTKAFGSVVWNVLKGLIGTVATWVGATVGIFWNMINGTVTELARGTLAGFRLLVSKLPGDWSGTLGIMDAAIETLAESAKEDLDDIGDLGRLTVNATKYFGEMVSGSLEASSGAGELARKLHETNKEVGHVSEALRGIASSKFGANIRAELDKSLKGFTKQGEEIEASQRRLDFLRESVSNLKEDFETQKIQFLNTKQIQESADKLTALLGKQGIELPIDISTLHAADQAEALVAAYTAAEQKIGHISGDMGRHISEGLGEKTKKAAEEAAHALEVRLAEQGVKKAQTAYDRLRDSVAQTNEKIMTSVISLAREIETSWASMVETMSVGFADTVVAIVDDAKTAGEALSAFLVNTTEAILQAIADQYFAQLAADANMKVLHEEKKMRLLEMAALEEALNAKKNALLGEEVAVKTATTTAVVAADSIEATSATVTAGTVTSAQGQKTTATTTTAAANIGETGTSVFKDIVASLGPLGIPVAAAAVAGLIALITGLLGKFLGASEGGLIVGGRRGKDSVPIMGMPGEYIMSVPEVQGVQKFMGAMGGSGTPQMASRPEATSTNVNIEFKSEQLPNKTETKRWVKQVILPAMRQLQAQGY